ncbi:helix-turn-helix domain-containing protein [Phycicoccus elongatus]|uniref:helix-turn-helix domain-containing protein n=1 Tax=Phycicoccus elongatus TaxID=101689 RepID=UPI0018DB7D96|nr:helix-turn-helix domain-containing protein [Phycicoccus elongatus]
MANWRPQPRTVIEEARLASGLGQSELAALAGTSQPTLSAYERGKKMPGLAVAERIANAAGWNIALQPRVSFTEHPAPEGFRFPFTVPDRLWRLEAPACFRTITFFDLVDEDNNKYWWDLSIRADRKLVYERLLTYGDEASLRLYLDAALLIDLWPEMDVPEPMRTHWAAVIEATMQAPIPSEHELARRGEDTRRTAVDVVNHATP